MIIFSLQYSMLVHGYEISGGFMNTTGSLSSFDSYEGKILVIDATASWCTGCDPQLQALQSVYNVVDLNVKILTLSVDIQDTIEKVTQLKARFSSPWEFGIDKREDFQSDYPISVLPTLHIFDQNGNLEQKWEGIIGANKIVTKINEIQLQNEIDNPIDDPYAVPDENENLVTSAFANLFSNQLFIIAIPFLLILLTFKLIDRSLNRDL